MNTTLLMRQSIIEALFQNIKALQEAWAEKGKPAFIRVEGGMMCELFISQSPEILHLITATPEEMIGWLFCSEDLKAQLIEVYSRLTPGTCLVVCDSDSSHLEHRITDWFVCSL